MKRFLRAQAAAAPAVAKAAAAMQKKKASTGKRPSAPAVSASAIAPRVWFSLNGAPVVKRRRVVSSDDGEAADAEDGLMAAVCDDDSREQGTIVRFHVDGEPVVMRTYDAGSRLEDGPEDEEHEKDEQEADEAEEEDDDDDDGDDEQEASAGPRVHVAKKRQIVFAVRRGSASASISSRRGVSFAWVSPDSAPMAASSSSPPARDALSAPPTSSSPLVRRARSSKRVASSSSSSSSSSSAAAAAMLHIDEDEDEEQEAAQPFQMVDLTHDAAPPADDEEEEADPVQVPEDAEEEVVPAVVASGWFRRVMAPKTPALPQNPLLQFDHVFLRHELHDGSLTLTREICDAATPEAPLSVEFPTDASIRARDNLSSKLRIESYATMVTKQDAVPDELHEDPCLFQRYGITHTHTLTHTLTHTIVPPLKYERIHVFLLMRIIFFIVVVVVVVVVVVCVCVRTCAFVFVGMLTDFQLVVAYATGLVSHSCTRGRAGYQLRRTQGSVV